jgi:hypothetical protein
VSFDRTADLSARIDRALARAMAPLTAQVLGAVAASAQPAPSRRPVTSALSSGPSLTPGAADDNAEYEAGKTFSEKFTESTTRNIKGSDLAIRTGPDRIGSDRTDQMLTQTATITGSTRMTTQPRHGSLDLDGRTSRATAAVRPAVRAPVPNQRGGGRPVHRRRPAPRPGVAGLLVRRARRPASSRSVRQPRGSRQAVDAPHPLTVGAAS